MSLYNRIARGYDELYKEEQLEKLGMIKSEINFNKKDRILDVGCGTGISSDLGCFVVGVDPSMGLLKQNCNTMKVLGCAEQLPFKSNVFDYVVSVTAIHNFSNIKMSLKEMENVGKKGFIISVLKRARMAGYIKKILRRQFTVIKELETGKDDIFFLQKRAKNA
ncbi:methyltransferase domain-containing protein [Candidatus Woesearchaeota archaeon]|nr:methyltransferase domain-containing protein [Candidatus Woesearchaeota archaeon]